MTIDEIKSQAKILAITARGLREKADEQLQACYDENEGSWGEHGYGFYKAKENLDYAIAHLEDLE